MKSTACAFCALLLIFAGAAQAREIGHSSPERQGFSSDRLNRLTQFMENKVADGTMVGGLGGCCTCPVEAGSIAASSAVAV